MSEENISLPVAQALASALEKIEAYVPTEYVDNSEPDIDAEHLNHAEQGIMRVTKLLNAAVDVIQGQESRLADAETKIGTAALTGGMTDLSSGLNALNSNLTNIQVGAITVAEVGNGIKDTEIRFPASFSKTPRVVVSAVSGTNNKNYGVMTVFADNITTNGFMLRIANTSADVFTPAVNWIAIAK